MSEPVATLHDDGCWTWKRDEFRHKYDSSLAGWRMDVYPADAIDAAREEGRQQLQAECERLRAAIKLIAAQDQGCGGRVTEAEAWHSAQTIALAALKEKQCAS